MTWTCMTILDSVYMLTLSVNGAKLDVFHVEFFPTFKKVVQVSISFILASSSNLFV